MIQIEDLFATAKRMICAGDITLLSQLLNSHPELAQSRDLPDGRDMQNTLLHEVTGMGNLEWTDNAAAIARLLIETGADINAPENPKGGETPLHHAVSVNNVEVARILLEAGANPELSGRYKNGIDTALGYALFYGTDERLERFRMNCPELLLRYGAELKLPFAAALNNRMAVQAFFQAPKSREKQPLALPSQQHINEAFLFACKYGNLEIAELLLKKGAQINACIPFFNYKVTALHLACESGLSIPMVRFLIKRGADPLIKDGIYDATPEGWAMFCGKDQVYRVLRQISYNS